MALERTEDTVVRETKSTLQWFYLGWVLEALRQSMKNRNEGENSESIPSFSYQYFGADEGMNSVYNKFYTDSESDESNAQLQRKDASDSIQSVFEIPVHLSAVKNIFAQYANELSLLDAIYSLISPGSIALPGVQLGIRNKSNKLEIFVISIIEGGMEQEIGINEKNDLDVTNAISVTFGSPNSLCENIAMTSQLDPNAYLTYKMQLDVGGGSIVNLLSDARFSPSIQEDLRKLYNEEVEEIKAKNKKKEDELEEARKAGTLSEVPARDREVIAAPAQMEKRYTAQQFISKYIGQDSRNYTKISKALLDNKDIFANLLGMFLRRTTLTLHGICEVNAYEAILVRGLVKRMEGIYTIISVTEQIGQDGYKTILECAMRKSLREIPGAQSG